MTGTTRTWPLFLAAPALLFAYSVVRLLIGRNGPDAGWAVGHLFLLAALLSFGVVLWQLWRWAAAGPRVRRIVAHAIGVVAVLGLAASLAQTVIDLVVGFRAADSAAQQRMFEQVQQYPVVDIVVYQVGPALFYLAFAALLVPLTLRPRLAAFWVFPAVLLGSIVTGVSLDLMPLGAVAFLVALGPWSWRRTAATAVPTGLGVPVHQ